MSNSVPPIVQASNDPINTFKQVGAAIRRLFDASVALVAHAKEESSAVPLNSILDLLPLPMVEDDWTSLVGAAHASLVGKIQHSARQFLVDFYAPWNDLPPLFQNDLLAIVIDSHPDRVDWCGILESAPVMWVIRYGVQIHCAILEASSSQPRYPGPLSDADADVLIGVWNMIRASLRMIKLPNEEEVEEINVQLERNAARTVRNLRSDLKQVHGAMKPRTSGVSRGSNTAPKPKRGRGRPKGSQTRDGDVKLWKDYEAAKRTKGSTKSDFVRDRGLKDSEGLAALERGRKAVNDREQRAGKKSD